MRRNYRLLFGPLAAAILAFGIASLAPLIPGYSHMHQTVSEIGEIGSPARVPFAIMLFCVAACILVFASAVRDVSVAAHHSQLAAYLIGFMAVPAAGTAIFAHPHPLHNIFGISELIAYQAPLVFALTWRGDPRAKILVASSWLLFVLIWVAIALNLSSIDRQGAIWAYVKPVYGIAQRTLFAAWFGWCAVVGMLLFQRVGSVGREEKVSLRRSMEL
jgi:multidrug transporter EmrE-like cation transporter